jgi:hypothetical protein
MTGAARRVVVVGCGLWADAEFFASLGGRLTERSGAMFVLPEEQCQPSLGSSSGLLSRASSSMAAALPPKAVSLRRSAAGRCGRTRAA